MEILEHESRHTDSRRRLTQLLTADLKQINLYEIEKDAYLGDHYHKNTTEYFYIMRGTLVYNDEVAINAGTFFKVSPEETHAIRCLTQVKMMTFLTKAYTEKDKDIWKKS